MPVPHCHVKSSVFAKEEQVAKPSKAIEGLPGLPAAEVRKSKAPKRLEASAARSSDCCSLAETKWMQVVSNSRGVMCGFLRYLSWKYVWQFKSYSLNRGETLGEAFAVDSISFLQQFSPTQHTEIWERDWPWPGLATGTTTTDLLSPGSPCNIHFDRSKFQHHQSSPWSPSASDGCHSWPWPEHLETRTDGWVRCLGMWSYVRSKINQNQPCHFEHLNVTLHDLKGLISVFGFIFSACFWKPHGNPHPTSVSATVRSKSLRTTATWTVIKSLVIVEVSVTTASLKWSEGSWWLWSVSVFEEHLPTPKICLLCKDCRMSLTPAFNNWPRYEPRWSNHSRSSAWYGGSPAMIKFLSKAPRNNPCLPFIQLLHLPLRPRCPSPVWRRGPCWWSQCDRSRHWWPHRVAKELTQNYRNWYFHAA